MPRALRQVCVYCGAAWGARPSYAAAARDLGRELARRGIILIYGGGKIGLMGEIADAAMAEGGQTIGVITQELVKKEIGHDNITELRVVETMHQRKKMMADLADAFIALPGGFGTFDELFEILTWAQLGLHDKPVGLLDTDGFYSGLMNFLGHASAEGFLRMDPASVLVRSPTPAELLDRLASAPPVVRRVWETTPTISGPPRPNA